MDLEKHLRIALLFNDDSTRFLTIPTDSVYKEAKIIVPDKKLHFLNMSMKRYDLCTNIDNKLIYEKPEVEVVRENNFVWNNTIPELASHIESYINTHAVYVIMLGKGSIDPIIDTLGELYINQYKKYFNI